MNSTQLIILLWILVPIFMGILAAMWFTGWATDDGRVYRRAQKDGDPSPNWTQAGSSEASEDEEVEDQEVKA